MDKLSKEFFLLAFTQNLNIVDYKQVKRFDMYIRRFSTLFNDNADYCICVTPIETCQYEAYTEPTHTFYEDILITDDIIVICKEKVERCLGIKLKGLEQIAI